MVPDGWQETKLGHLFKSRRVRGEAGLPTLSVTLGDGLVRRESLDRKMDTNLTPEQHLLVRKGDIAYNMMRMWQGASGLAGHDALVSPAYVVLEPTELIDPLFASYFFKTPRMIYLFWAYSHGLTEDRLRLYFDDFSLIPVTVPKVTEQKRIAEILATWDSAIDVINNTIVNSEAQKLALSRQLLSRKKRLRQFPDTDWKVLSLKDVAHVIASNVDKKTADDETAVRLCNYTDVYANDVIDGDLAFMRATASSAQIERFRLCTGDVIITKDSETSDDIAVPAYVQSSADDLLCGYHLAIIRPKKGISGRYLKYYFEHTHTRKYFTSRANGAIRFGLSVRSIERAPIAIPSFKEQKYIAELIAAAESEIRFLRHDLERLKIEKVALMQKLFTGQCRVKRKEEVT